MNDTSAIAVFDSGLGGLTVLRALCQALPNESYVYLGDTARLPYGTKSPETLHKYIQQNINFLLTKNIKAVVVACNSAASVIRQTPIVCPVPLFEVIQPGSETALRLSESKRIGVVGTWATVSQEAYKKALLKLDNAAVVHQQACPLLVSLVEEGWVDDPLTNLIIHRYVSPLLGKGIDTLILGCTHYPVLRGAFQKVAGPNMQLVDSAEAIALQVKEAINKGSLKARPAKSKAIVRLMTTDRGAHFTDLASRLLSPIIPDDVEVVDLL